MILFEKHSLEDRLEHLQQMYLARCRDY